MCNIWILLRSLIRSLGHLASDLLIVTGLFYAATFIDHPDLPSWAKYILWPVYWFVQVRERHDRMVVMTSTYMR